MKKAYPVIVFLVTLVIISVYYDYPEISFKRPQSVHKWRQSDCASIALNYYQGGMKFFSPETHNLTSDGGTSGKACTSEIPILYYAVGILYKIFGYHEYIYRIFNTLLFFLGLLYLFRLFQRLLGDVYWSVTLTLLFFTSPILVFYGNNFLSNSSALSFSIIGWFYFTCYFTDNRPKWFYISMVFFFLAAAFKVTALFSLFAISGIFISELSGFIKLRDTGRLFDRKVPYIFSIILVISLIAAWLVYAHQYNQKHDCTYFSTTIFPIWDLTRAEITFVLNNIREIWLDQYFHKSILIFLATCFIFILVFFRENKRVFIYSIVFICFEIMIYILLQFWTFADHDYYVIDIYILPVLVVISAFLVLKSRFFRIFSSAISKIAFAIFLLFNIYYAHNQLEKRYSGWMNDYPANKDIYSITPYLRTIGISSMDTVISVPDRSHASLYIMNQKGWTEYTDARFNRGIKIRYNQDSAGIRASIDKGAGYLIMNGISELYQKPYLQAFCKNLKGYYENVLIFDLKNKEGNFHPEQRITDQFVWCDAEQVSRDRQYFISRTDSTLFQYGTSQSDEFAHSGQYSCRSDARSPYGMTVKMKDLKNGESFRIYVWRRTNGNSKGALIASSSPNPYYNNNFTVIETSQNGWERLAMEFFIRSELAGQELVIYVYNRDKEPVYFDDLEITRYKSILNQ